MTKAQLSLLNKPQHEKMYLLSCAPNEDSNQPAQSAQSNQRLRYPYAEMSVRNAPSEDSDQTARMRRLI